MSNLLFHWHHALPMSNTYLAFGHEMLVCGISVLKVRLTQLGKIPFNEFLFLYMNKTHLC